eukprot:14140066-Alexandrium_andersonii.AAC.1
MPPGGVVLWSCATVSSRCGVRTLARSIWLHRFGVASPCPSQLRLGGAPDTSGQGWRSEVGGFPGDSRPSA